jgi:hypothetical protein
MMKDGHYDDQSVESVTIVMEPGLRMKVDQMIFTLQEAMADFPDHDVVKNIETWTELGQDGEWREHWGIDLTVGHDEN